MQKPHLRDGVMLPSTSISALSSPESKTAPPRGIVRNAAEFSFATGAACWKGRVGLKKAALTEPATATATERAMIVYFMIDYLID